MQKSPSLLRLEIQQRAKEFLDEGNLLALQQGTYHWLNDALLQMRANSTLEV